MKIRALGTGSKFCRHPLTPASFLIVSGSDLTLVGAPWSVVPALERHGHALSDIAVITVLSPQIDQVAGLVELAAHFKGQKKKPILAAPAKLIERIRPKIEEEVGFFLHEAFSVKSVVRLLIKEEFFSESLTFVPNYMDPNIPSFGLLFESAQLFISGETSLNEDWLFKWMTAETILHVCTTRNQPGSRAPSVDELQSLPMYLQRKIWLYGYETTDKDAEQPFPMMFLPPSTYVFDSERRDKHLSKERFIRENSKKQI